MRTRIIVAGALVGAAVFTLVFLIAPVMAWKYEQPPDAYFKAQASPSYFYFKCGTTYDFGLVYTANGQFDVYEPGLHWHCPL